MKYRVLVGNQVRFITAADDSVEAYRAALAEAEIDIKRVVGKMKIRRV